MKNRLTPKFALLVIGSILFSVSSHGEAEQANTRCAVATGGIVTSTTGTTSCVSSWNKDVPIQPVSQLIPPDLTADQKAIALALLNRDPERALALIQKTRDGLLFPISKVGITSLSYSSISGYSKVVEAILDRGIKPGNDLDTALFQALESGVSLQRQSQIDTIQVLLKHGAHPRIRDSMGRTAFMHLLWAWPKSPEDRAAAREVAKSLIAAGADLEETTIYGIGINAERPRFTPLSMAAYHGDTALIQLLLDSGANPLAQGSVALAAALHGSSTEAAELLLRKGSDPNAQSYLSTDSIFAEAVNLSFQKEHLDFAMLLLKAGADPNACVGKPRDGACENGHGYLVLIRAIDLGNVELVNALLSKGANPNATTGTGGQFSQPPTILEWVLSSQIQPPPDHKEKFDRTALVKTLLNAGADPNKRSGTSSPLAMTRDDEPEVTMAMLDKGARIEDVASGEGERIGPITQMILNKRSFLAMELIRRTNKRLGRNERHALRAAVSYGALDIVDALLAAKSNPNDRGPLEETPLHLVNSKGASAMVKRLVDAGADPNAKGGSLRELRSYLMSKASTTNFILAGIQPAFPDGRATPLMVAAATGNVEAVQALLNAGADPTIVSESGFTAAGIAARNYNETVVNLLATSKSH